MSFFIKKIPRGVIYHSVMQSARYLARALWMPLNHEGTIRQFEAAFARHCLRKHCIAFPFARTAIYFVLKSLNLPKGSEVIMPPITIKGIVDVVVDLGLVPHYVDLDPDTICFCLGDLRSKIGSATKVAIVTPLFGLVPDMPEMMKLFREHGVFVIEDFSQCLNARFDNKRIGTFGDVGIYSSSSIKTLDTLGGGLAVTDDERLYKVMHKAQMGELHAPSRKFLIKKAWINLVRNVATSQPWFSLLTFPVLQFIRNRNPEVALKQTGHRDKRRLSKLPALWFCRYTSVQAGIGLKNLGKVNGDDAKRIANVDFLKEGCGEAHFPGTTNRSTNVYWQLIMLTPDAVSAQSFFSSRGVDIATSSLELVCALKGYPGQEELPEARRIYSNGVFIPCYPELSQMDMARIGVSLREYFDANSR